MNLTPDALGVIQALVDAIPHYVLAVDEDHVIVVANIALRDSLGLGPDEVVGEYCPRLIHGTDGPFHGCPLEVASLMKRGVGSAVKLRLELHDGPCRVTDIPGHACRGGSDVHRARGPGPGERHSS